MKVSNGFGTATSSNSLAVVPLLITIQPQSQFVYGGSNVSFNASAISVGPFGYQWLLNGTNILGATNSSLVLTNVQMDAAGTYSVVVSNLYGVANSSNAVLAISPLGIISNPQSQYVPKWATATLSSTALGIAPISYQWRLNGTNLAGATNNFLTFTNIQFSQAGTYTLLVSNPITSLESGPAELSAGQVAFLGVDYVDPMTVPTDLTNLVAVASGIALRADGLVVSLGQPNLLAGSTNLVAIANGMALKADGTVIVAGQTNLPADLTNVVAIADGLALRSDGTVVSVTQTDLPAGLTNIVKINNGMAVRADGTAISISQPNLPADLTNAVALAAGWESALGLREDGTVFAWPTGSLSNLRGQLNVPPNLTNAVAIACGDLHCLALTAKGTVVSWGGYCCKLDTFYVRPDLKNVVAFGNDYSDLALVGDGPPLISVPLAKPTLNSNGFSVLLPTQSGRVYRLEYKNSLSDIEWIGLPLVAGSGGMKTLIDSTAANTQRFYRVRQW